MWEVSMEGPDRDQRGNPQGMFMASVDMVPFTKYLDENGNKITINTVAEMLADQLEGEDATEDELAQFIEHLISHGATVSDDDGEEVPTDEGAPIDDNGHPEENNIDNADYDDDDDFDWGDDEEDVADNEELDYDKIASYAKKKPVANEPASDERVKSNKKPCAEEPKSEVASDEKCKENKKPCTEEDSTRFSDESLKNIIGVLADRIL